MSAFLSVQITDKNISLNQNTLVVLNEFLNLSFYASNLAITASNRRSN